MKGKSNPVAKHLRTFNKATVQRDRKKDSKLGKKNKYKKDIYKEDGDLEKARDNVGRDSCWDGYKAKDTKMKNGKMVPDCKKESSCEGDSSERKTKSLRALRFEYKTKYKNEARIDPTDGKSTSRDSSVKQVKSKADFMKGRKDTRKKPRLSHKEEVDEGLAVKSGNESGGYYNASYNIKHGKNEPKTKEDYVKTHAVIKKMTGGKDSQIKDYLDSKRGRHLVGKEQDKLYVKKDFSKWIRSYNPDDYRWESVEQVDEISRGMKNRYIQRAAMSAASNAHSDGISKTTGRKNNHKDKVLNRLRGINRATKESSEDFTPHDMFDPKTGEKKRAETLDMHLALKAKGWGHSKNESVEEGNGAWAREEGGLGALSSRSKKNQAKDKAVAKAHRKANPPTVYPGGLGALSGRSKKNQAKDRAVAKAQAKRDGYKLAPKRESVEQVDEGITKHQIHKSTDHGKTWKFDTEHSTKSKAEELIKQRMKAVSIGKKYKIVRSTGKKLAGPQGKLPESVEQVDEISQGAKDRYVAKAQKDIQNRRKKRSDMKGGFGTLPDNPKTPEEKKKWMRNALKRPNRHAGIRRAGAVPESVEQVDEGLMNDIRDFIVAVGAAIPTKKNKNNAKWKSLENEIRMAMEADPEFDKLVRNAAYVRKDGIIAFRSGTHSKIDAYVRKTVDSKAAEKLGTLQKGYIKTLKSGEKRNIGRSSDFTKKQQADIDSGKTVYDDDMESTLRHTTNAISKVIKSVTQRAHYDAQQEKKRSSKPLSAVTFKKESVEHLDEFNRIMHFKSDLNFKINPKWTAKEIDSEIKKMTADVKKFAILTKNRKHGWDTNKMPDDQWKRKDYLRKLIWHKKNGIKESVERVDEISRGLATRYVGKARTDIKNQDKKMDDVLATKRSKQGLAKFDKAARKQDNRFRGINRALPKMREDADQVDELTQREKEMIADRKAKRMSKAGRKDRNTRLLPKTTTYVRPSKGEDDHIVMQLRKAQDSANFGNGEFDIRVSPVKGAATVSLKKPQIDKLLAVHDKLEKPDQKRKYRITLLKTLRSMQQKKK
tara:strand:- start:5883 stop:9029 length:3147 start_codon:yes stop_codon:yes gene_type:complete